ncbi:MAG: hypothetical protein MRZ54_11475 [Clostridiales bacterium]|nr:hypothetical protein [Clostridiales bacterium]
MKLNMVRFGWPTPDTPYYFLHLCAENVTQDTEVAGVTVNGRRCRDFETRNDGRAAVPPVLRAQADKRELYIRVDWQKGDTFDVAVTLKSGESSVELRESYAAAQEHGYWNKDWKYYAAHVVKETAGIDRVDEPVHAVLAMYMDRLTDAQRELRVVEVDSHTGEAREIRSQVYAVSSWDKWQNINCQPTTTAQIAFLANVPANGQRVYLFFYGNPNAPQPCYETDLCVSGEGYGLSIQNEYYTVNLHKDSGSIDEILPRDREGLTYCHQLETNGALQWNPGIYAPPKTWMHASDWVAPKDFTVISGPIFVMVKRFNPIVDYEEVECSLTYIFYSCNKAITVESNIDITKDLDVVALRNGSVVLNKETTGDFVWKDVDHQVRNVHIQDMPRHPVKAMTLDARTPWFAFYNRHQGNALGVVNLEFGGVRRQGGLIEWEPHYYLHWGPWFYVSRPIIYTFTSNNPQRVMHMTTGTSFFERYELFAFNVEKGGQEYDGFEEIERMNRKAREPLSKLTAKYDTDERVPDEWVPPILASHFEEMVD